MENVLDITSLCISTAFKVNLDPLKNYIVNKTIIIVNAQKCCIIMDKMIDPRDRLSTWSESELFPVLLQDCHIDSVNLYNQFGIQPKNVFNTQAAHDDE